MTEAETDDQILMHAWGFVRERRQSYWWWHCALRARSRTSATVVDASRYGDFVGVVGDPLVDVRLLEAPAFVMKAGEVVKAASGR